MTQTICLTCPVAEILFLLIYIYMYIYVYLCIYIYVCIYMTRCLAFHKVFPKVFQEI